jgi:hypothetical protein
MSKKDFIQGIHFYLENGIIILTEKYLLQREKCCKNFCRHCPYKKLNKNEHTKTNLSDSKSGETKHKLRQGDTNSRDENSTD